MPPSAGLTATRAAAFTFSVLALVSTWIFVFAFYRQYRKDLLVVKLRGIRDGIWDFATEHGWPVAEGEVRRTLDYAGAAIAAASGLSLTRLFLFQTAALFWPVLRLASETNGTGKLGTFCEDINRALAQHIAVFPLYWFFRKLNLTWPPAGAIAALVHADHLQRSYK